MNTAMIRTLGREHLLKVWCLAAITMLSFTLTGRATILDDLFRWAAQQPSTNVTTVQVAMTGNEITRNKLVSYAVGTLYYHPAHVLGGGLFIPASFSSEENGITQYFSDRRFNCKPDQFINYPFDPSNTDPLTIAVSFTFVPPTPYAINLSSSKWGFNFRFIPGFDANTKILYGTMGPTFLTVSLYNQRSQPQPIIQ
jgi:hypothetical protein